MITGCRCAVSGRWGRPPTSGEVVCLSTKLDDDRAKRFLDTRLEVLGAAKSGNSLRIQVRWVNTSDGTLRVRFTRGTEVSAAILDGDGKGLPIEGPDNCSLGGIIGQAEFSEITLPRGGEVTAETSLPARRLRRKATARPDLDCGTFPGSALPPGKYRLSLGNNPRWLGLPVKALPFELR